MITKTFLKMSQVLQTDSWSASIMIMNINVMINIMDVKYKILLKIETAQKQ